MKNKVLFLFILTFFVILQVIQTAGQQTTPTSSATSPSSTTDSESSAFTETKLYYTMFEEYAKPSKAFTAVILVYFGLIVIGAILVLVLVKPMIEN